MKNGNCDQRPVNAVIPSAQSSTASMVDAPDEGLLRQISQGNTAAFSELYERYAARLFGLIIKIVHDRQAAEDVLQEVFLHVWRQAGRYDPALSRPLVWLMLVARGRAIDRVRRRGAQAAIVEKLDRPVTAFAREFDCEQSQRARHALEQLPAEQMHAISLAFHGGLTYVQIAQLEDQPLGTIKTRIRLGLRKIRDLMGQEHEVST